MHLDLLVRKFSKNKLAKAEDNKKEIGAAGNHRSSAPGVTSKASKMKGPIEELDDDDVERLRYEFTVRIEKKTFKNEDVAKRHLDIARTFVERKAESLGWKVEGEKSEVVDRQAAADNRPEFVVPDLTADIFKKYFIGIKERQPHIRLIHSSTVTFRETEGDERNHTMLYGEAASCKSTLFDQFKKWYEEDNTVERVLKVNATTLSKAGLEMLLLEKAEQNMLPDILWVNELEKGESEDFLCLLSVMDGMGEITRLNRKVGRRQAQCKILVWCDCNDEQKIKNWQSGALWSRFSKKYPCVRPSREVMLEILEEAIEKRMSLGRRGNKKWAKAAVDYCYDVMKTDDPRAIKSMLDGGDGLLDGSYFKDIESIKLAQEIASQQKVLMRQ